MIPVASTFLPDSCSFIRAADGRRLSRVLCHIWKLKVTEIASWSYPERACAYTRREPAIGRVKACGERGSMAFLSTQHWFGTSISEIVVRDHNMRRRVSVRWCILFLSAAARSESELL